MLDISTLKSEDTVVCRNGAVKNVCAIAVLPTAENSEKLIHIIFNDDGFVQESATYNFEGKANPNRDSGDDIVEVNPKVIGEPIDNIINWFKACVPVPLASNLFNQLGCDIEEFTEKLLALVPTPDSKEIYEGAIAALNLLKEEVYKGNIRLGEPRKKSKIDLLDGICDSIVTNVGLGVLHGFDVKNALIEVIASNNSKLVDGKPVFSELMKIMKPESYFAPNLESFIGD